MNGLLRVNGGGQQPKVVYLNKERGDKELEDVAKAHIPFYLKIIATFVGLIVATFNFIGFAFFGYELANQLIAAAIFTGFIGILINFGKLVAYLRGGGFFAKATLHLLAAIFTSLFIAHILDYSVNVSEKKHDEFAVAKQEYEKVQIQLQAISESEGKLTIIKQDINSIKAKKVKKGTVWSDSNNCTNDKHPADCTKIANLELEGNHVMQQVAGFDKTILQARSVELFSKIPEITLKKPDLIENQSIVMRLHEVIAKDVTVSAWFLIISMMLSLIVELVEAIVLSPFSPQKKSQKY